MSRCASAQCFWRHCAAVARACSPRSIRRRTRRSRSMRSGASCCGSAASCTCWCWPRWRWRSGAGGARVARRRPATARLTRALPLMLAAWVGAIALGLIVLTASSFLVDRHLAPGPDPALTVRVTGQQWWWQIEYLEPRIVQHFSTANELHLPVGRARAHRAASRRRDPQLLGPEPVRQARHDPRPRQRDRADAAARSACSAANARNSAACSTPRWRCDVHGGDAAAFAAWRSAPTAAGRRAGRRRC